MNIIAQIVWVVQTAAVPILAVLMAIVVINMMKSPGKVTAEDEEHFKVTESSFWLVIASFGVVTSIVFLWLSSTNKTEGSIATAYFIVILCLAITAGTLYTFFKRKLVVDGECMTYYPLKGKAESFDVKTFGKMEIIQQPRCEEIIVYNKIGKKLFKIEGYMVNAQVLKKYMRKRPVRIVKINNDTDKKA